MEAEPWVPTVSASGTALSGLSVSAVQPAKPAGAYWLAVVAAEQHLALPPKRSAGAAPLQTVAAWSLMAFRSVQTSVLTATSEVTRFWMLGIAHLVQCS